MMGRIDHTAFEDHSHNLWVQGAIRSDEAFKARMRELGYVSYPDMQAVKLKAMRKALKKKVKARLQRETQRRMNKRRKEPIVFTGNLPPQMRKAWTQKEWAKLIVVAVARKHGVTAQDIYSDRRFKKIVRARWEAMWRLKEKTTWSLEHIGRFLGHKDHSTVLHGIRNHAKIMEAGE